MLKNRMQDKVLVVILIFTLTFANFAYTTESLATSLTEIIFGSDSDTGHKNVQFEAYFETENEKSYSVVSDVNNQELAINFMVGVQKSGYLKDAQIEITGTEEKGINYELKKDLELSDSVQSLEDNILKLRQVEHSSEINVSIPIEYKNETYVNEEKFVSDSKAIFTATYVDEKGNDVEISKEIMLNVSWKDTREVSVATEITKYIQFGNDTSKGIILQTLVKVDNRTEGNSLPVKETELIVEIPKMGQVNPTAITVIANSTEGTNGKNAENVKFDQNNWSINDEGNTLTIKAKNEKQSVIVNGNEEEYLIDSEKELIEEERYYSKSGIDEYLITYTFENIDIPSELDISFAAQANLVTLSGVEKDEFMNIVSSNQNFDYVLTGQTGDIVSYNIENLTEEVSKIYTYLNYNSDSKYEIEYNTKTIVNVSYKEIVESIIVEDLENLYLNKEGNETAHDDLYYKEIQLDKENFDNILGEDGIVQILDENGNVIVTINKEYEVTEEGKIVVKFSDKYSKLSLRTSAPMNEGNLIINNKKATTDSSFSKESYKSLSDIMTKIKVSAVYNYVENPVEIETQTVSTKLVDTTTKANLTLDRDNLSTLAMNENVELRVELNNDKETSDIYENPVFEIEMPEYVKNIEVTNTDILYAEGLEIANVEGFIRDNKVILKITLDGRQNGINSGVITNGTNVIINANIKVDLFTPAMEEEIKLYYINQGATNYETELGYGYESVVISYSAPTGLVAVNSVSNYNNAGSVLTSVKQGRQEDMIEIYAEAKKATMEIVVMNNNNNTVSDVSILGRIPFKGVKDIATGNDLGTTIDTMMISKIVSDERNGMEFDVYYSENGEATNDLTDSSNGWTMNPESLAVIKSYLMIPVESNYEMKEAEALRFTYEYEIPANLEHNENIYGTFLVYYTNNSEVAVTEEISKPDTIGLTTGEGPELDLEVSTNTTNVKEYEELRITAKITNTGTSVAGETKVNIPVPTNTTYTLVETDRDNITTEVTNNVVSFNIGNLEINETVSVVLIVSINRYPTIEEYYKGTPGFARLDDGTYVLREYYGDDGHNYTDKTITSIPEVIINVKATATAKDLGKELDSNNIEIKVNQAEFAITEKSEEEEWTYKEGTVLKFIITARNLTADKKDNVTVTKTLLPEFSFVEAYTLGYEADGVTSNKIHNAFYDETTRQIQWNLGNLNEYEVKQLNVNIKINALPEGVLKHTVYTSSQITANESEVYDSNLVKIMLGKPSLVINQTTTTTNTYVTEGSTINYIFTVKNEGSVTADSVTFRDKIPDGLSVRKMTYTLNGITSAKRVSSNTEVILNTNILPGDELVVNIEALAKSLNGVQEKSVTNQGEVTIEELNEMPTNSITHIIEANPNSAAAQAVESSSSSGTYGGNTSNNIVKTYKLTGAAWLDDNKNGQRDTSEQVMSGIIARLVNSDTGVIVKSVTTDSKGEYNFAGISNGNYLVIFDYDTVKYTVTAYKKDGVSSNVNSKAITTKIIQDGKQRNGAVTDIIVVKDSSVSNIDIGFVLADTFDLEINKAISKITVQNRAGTVSNPYNRVPLAKTEIGSKYLSGSTVYIEYIFSVSNTGEISGFAKKIMDHIPDGMSFNSGLNPDWYTGLDGKLYTTALSENEIRVGETKEVKLVLTKQMTEENTGMVHNTAEIYEDYNIYGVTDKNENSNSSSADAIISVKTGEVFIYISVIITSVILGSIVIFIAYNRIVLSKRKGGV